MSIPAQKYLDSTHDTPYTGIAARQLEYSVCPEPF